jgi:hypothetical protein
MSISRLNVRSLASVASVAVSCWVGTAFAEGASDSTRLTQAEVAKARQAALPALKSSVAESAGRVPKLRLPAAPVWSDASPTHRALLPVAFTYPGADYVYCRLVILPADLSTAQVADAMAIPDCKGMTKAFFTDVNDDGLLDVIASLRVQSNSVDALLDVPAVFLSDASAPGGWCYSQQASDHLQPEDLASAERASSALKRERVRLKLDRFACGGN